MPDTGHVRLCTLSSAPVIGKARDAAPAYLTYPAETGFTVTYSRGFSPHSAAGEVPGPRCPDILFPFRLYRAQAVFARCKTAFYDRSSSSSSPFSRPLK